MRLDGVMKGESSLGTGNTETSKRSNSRETYMPEKRLDMAYEKAGVAPAGRSHWIEGLQYQPRHGTWCVTAFVGGDEAVVGAVMQRRLAVG